MFGASSSQRIRKINPYYSRNWFAVNDVNDVADEIIVAPERHLLTADELNSAEGGNMGQVLQLGGLALGVCSVFISSPVMGRLWKTGSLKWAEWFCLSGAGMLGYQTARFASIHGLGDYNKYRNHWMAYSYVKSHNRWEGRQILSNAPLVY